MGESASAPAALNLCADSLKLSSALELADRHVAAAALERVTLPYPAND